MSESTATEEKDDARAGEERDGDDREEKKGRPWKRILFAVLALIVILLIAVVVLGGSSKKKAAPGGTLKVGKQQLLPLPASGKLSAAPGQEVAGKKLVVRSIVKGQGFFVGGSKASRVYVAYAGPSNKVGGTVNLNGVVKPAPGDVAKTLKLSREDAAKVTAEAAYINASTVTAGP